MSTEDAERRRLLEESAGPDAWRLWGPYLSERAWGTVREDYSPEGSAWEYFPHDHARSRAYRWSEDGLGGICDRHQRLCLAFAFWNGADPIIKERIYGLSGPEGNHGEDAKEYWWYLDSTPTHSWMRWRYLYPQREFPYAQLREENRQRGRDRPEYELADTGVLDGGHWEITVDYAKAAPDDICMEMRVRNTGDVEATIDVLPTLWFRNTWSWSPRAARPRLRLDGGRLLADHRDLGRYSLSSDAPSQALFCDNETNAERIWAAPDGPRFPKDGINDHVVHGLPTVNPEQTGTKAALRHRLTIGPGATAPIRLRLSAEPAGVPGSEQPLIGVVGTGQADGGAVPRSKQPLAAVLRARHAEADFYHRSLLPPGTPGPTAEVVRQALAGMLWSKQFYHLDVELWLDGDPGQPPPPESRQTGRNSGWRHLNNWDVISMPDTWEYPWYAAWDLAFHTVVLAHVDPVFAKEQLILLCREWYMHPNGQLPAYEWAFDDVNPPVHAWAALRVYEIAGDRDNDFLERIFHKLLLNFTWWVNRKDSEGNNVFEGGFLGLDNIGPFDRSAQLPVAGRLEQSDGTAWMAMYCLNLLEIALVLAERDRTYEDMATKFFEHFIYIASAMNRQGLWDEQDGFYYDVLRLDDGSNTPLRARSMVGLIPLCATTTIGAETLARLPDFAIRLRWFLDNRAHLSEACALDDGQGNLLLAVVRPDRLERVLAYMLDENEFLSAHGLRALSKVHRDHPLLVTLGGTTARVDYEPGESSTGLFGGNSNWRGPIWFPLNHLLIESLRRFHRFFGAAWCVEHPTRSGVQLSLDAVAEDLSRRLLSIFLDGPDGRRPVFGSTELFQRDPSLHACIPFHEYFHGDTGAGLGASHQTGWTGLVADLVLRSGAAPRPRDQPPISPGTGTQV